MIVPHGGSCSVCGHARGHAYTGPFYATERPDVLCPWCIADGRAAIRYKGDFQDYGSIEGIAVLPGEVHTIAYAPEDLDELCCRTPGYTGWQQERWLGHCATPCAVKAYVGTADVERLADELYADIVSISASFRMMPDDLVASLRPDGHMVGYLFQCVVCGHHRLHVDID